MPWEYGWVQSTVRTDNQCEAEQRDGTTSADVCDTYQSDDDHKNDDDASDMP